MEMSEDWNETRASKRARDREREGKGKAACLAVTGCQTWTPDLCELVRRKQERAADEGKFGTRSQRTKIVACERRNSLCALAHAHAFRAPSAKRPVCLCVCRARASALRARPSVWPGARPASPGHESSGATASGAQRLAAPRSNSLPAKQQQTWQNVNKAPNQLCVCLAHSLARSPNARPPSR